MLRLLKRCWWMVLLTAGATTVSAFSLLGPNNEAYQVPAIGYNPRFFDALLSAPKQIGEEYRRNTPTMYYTFDQTFLDYFGSNGVAAIDAAFAILNGVTNVSSYSADLSEFPLQARRYNYQAEALELEDLKSRTLQLLLENLGLADSPRYTWVLHDRYQEPGTTCPDGMDYFVVPRNIDPVPSPLNQYQYSPYVNGALLTYTIIELCTPAIDGVLADAAEFPVDPLAASIYTPIAAAWWLNGQFYTGLTRDDVGGLRYLLRTNNINVESAGVGTTTFSTNLNSSQLLVSSNLSVLVAQAVTNDAAALTALYPDLVIAGTTSIFTNVVTTNATAYFTNFPWSPAYSPPTLVFATNYTTNVATWFHHTFANVVTNSYYTNGIVKLQTTTVGSCPLAPPGFLCTNTTWMTLSSNAITGDYFVLPTNSCGFSIVSTQLVTTFGITNLVLAATNSTGSSNQFSQSTVTFFTNHIFVIHPVDCVDDSLTLRQGIERIRFVRRDYDSLIGQYYEPITNDYTLVAVTNNALVPQMVRRVVTQPDFLFSASDFAPGPDARPYIFDIVRTINFNTANALPGLAGPGTIEPSTQITYNKFSPSYFNFRIGGFAFLDQATAIPGLLWGSFDGTTNAPVVYPNGTSITNLENQILIQVSPTTPVTNGVVYLPNATVGSNYATVFSGFSVTGGQSPYSWAVAPGSAGLPPNLFLNPNGTISGAPANGTQGLTFDFVIRLTDAGGRYVDRPFAITINP